MTAGQPPLWFVTAHAQDTTRKGPMSWKAAIAFRARLKADPTVAKVEIEDEAEFRRHTWTRP